MGIRSFLKTTYFVFKMMFTFPSIIIGFYLRRRKAQKVFRRELIESGVPPVEAGKLADSYPFKLGDIVKMARSFSSARQPPEY